jgi:hypothetical protein
MTEKPGRRGMIANGRSELRLGGVEGIGDGGNGVKQQP